MLNYKMIIGYACLALPPLLLHNAIAAIPPLSDLTKINYINETSDNLNFNSVANKYTDPIPTGKHSIVTPGIFKMNRYNKRGDPKAIAWIDLYDRGIQDFCIFGADVQNWHLQCYKNNGGDFSTQVLLDENIQLNYNYGANNSSVIFKAGRDPHNNLRLGLCSGGRKDYYNDNSGVMNCIYYTQDDNGKFSKMNARQPGMGYPDYSSRHHIDWGYEDQIILSENDQMHSNNRWFVDLSGNDEMSYCRIVGNDNDYKLACRFSLGTQGFAADEIYSEPMDMGYNPTRSWVQGIRGYPASYCRVVGNQDSHRIRCLPFDPATHKFGQDLDLGPIDNWTDEQFRWVNNFTSDGVPAVCLWNNHHDWVCTTAYKDFSLDPVIFHMGTNDNDSLGFVAFPYTAQKGLCYLFDFGHMACGLQDVVQTDMNHFEIVNKMNSSGGTIVWGSGSIQDGHRIWINYNNDFDLYCRDDGGDMRCNKVFYE